MAASGEQGVVMRPGKVALRACAAPFDMSDIYDSPGYELRYNLSMRFAQVTKTKIVYAPAHGTNGPTSASMIRDSSISRIIAAAGSVPYMGNHHAPQLKYGRNNTYKGSLTHLFLVICDIGKMRSAGIKKMSSNQNGAAAHISEKYNVTTSGIVEWADTCPIIGTRDVITLQNKSTTLKRKSPSFGIVAARNMLGIHQYPYSAWTRE